MKILEDGEGDRNKPFLKTSLTDAPKTTNHPQNQTFRFRQNLSRIRAFNRRRQWSWSIKIDAHQKLFPMDHQIKLRSPLEWEQVSPLISFSDNHKIDFVSHLTPCEFCSINIKWKFIKINWFNFAWEKQRFMAGGVTTAKSRQSRVMDHGRLRERLCSLMSVALLAFKSFVSFPQLR